MADNRVGWYCRRNKTGPSPGQILNICRSCSHSREQPTQGVGCISIGLVKAELPNKYLKECVDKNFKWSQKKAPPIWWTKNEDPSMTVWVFFYSATPILIHRCSKMGPQGYQGFRCNQCRRGFLANHTFQYHRTLNVQEQDVTGVRNKDVKSLDSSLYHPSFGRVLGEYLSAQFPNKPSSHHFTSAEPDIWQLIGIAWLDEGYLRGDHLDDTPILACRV